MIASEREMLEKVLREAVELSLSRYAHSTVVAGCKNIGFDLSCSGCASLFFTGSVAPHDEGCATTIILPGWTCPVCHGFNGEAKERLEKCRACEGARP